MGTNYYLRYNICDCCDRYDEIHVGKSSFGWSFSFHAIDDYIDMKLMDPKHLLADSPEQKIIIDSYKKWQQFINTYVVHLQTAKIYDEYGTEESPQSFYKLVEDKLGGKNHAYEMKNDPQYSHVYSNRDFIDEDGHSFSKHEFS